MSPDTAARVDAFARALDALAGDPEALHELAPATVQTMLSVSTRAFAARYEAGELSQAFVGDGPPPTATDVVMTTSAMLAGAEIELFELGLWQTWGASGGDRAAAQRDGSAQRDASGSVD